MPVLPSFRNQLNDQLRKSIDQFLYEVNTGISLVKYPKLVLIIHKNFELLFSVIYNSKEQSLSFPVVFKIFIFTKLLFSIPNKILRFILLYCSFLVKFKTRDDRGKHNFEKQYCCGNYSDDVYQCLNTDQILLKIQYFHYSTLQKISNN